MGTFTTKYFGTYSPFLIVSNHNLNNTALQIINDIYNMLLGCYTNDVDSPGNDIYSLSGVSSVGACQQHCNLKDNCQYFMYGSAVSLGTCWLKYGRVTTLTPYNGLIFGPKLCGTRILLQNMYANYI